MDEAEFIALLQDKPTPEQILTLRPSPNFQARVNGLLAQSKAGVLSRESELELEHYLALEHVVRMAKAHAYAQLNGDM